MAVNIIKLKAQPGRPHHPERREIKHAFDVRTGPQIGIMVRTESAASINLPGRFASVPSHAPHQIMERRFAFHKSHFGHEPIIHIQIDVHGELALPGRLKRAVPDSLQIRRQSAV